MAKFAVGSVSTEDCVMIAEEIGAIIQDPARSKGFDDADKVRKLIEKRHGKGVIAIALREMVGRFHRQTARIAVLSKKIEDLESS